MPVQLRWCRVVGLLVGGALLATARPAPATSQSAISRGDLHRIDSTLQAAARAGFSGTVLIATGQTVAFEAAYGSNRGVPVRMDTRFWIASTAKQFVTAAVLKCVERGLLSLEDSLGQFFADVSSEKRGITLRQLLNHTSGLGQSYASEDQANREGAVRAMLSESLAQSPGVSFRYSNSNIQLAVAIVEVVSGQSYQDFARRELWSQAALSGTGFAGDSAASHGLDPAVGDTPDRLLHPSWGGEGVYSTANDLFRWYRDLRRGRVLSQRSAAELFTPVAPISEGHTGLAWFLGQSPAGRLRIFTRGNEGFGANSLIYAYPERDIVIIVLTHAGNADGARSWSRAVHEQIESLLSL